jgi:O-acetylserine/cysteine efflux transporter
MERNRNRAVVALITAGVLWGTTVPLSKVALEWLPAAWLTFARFGLACLILLAVSRSGIRAACRPAILGSGAIGYGGSVLLQNAGIARTSVSHAALLVGAVPVLVAIIAAISHRRMARPLAWTGFAVSLAGVVLVTTGRAAGVNAPGGAATLGDGLVLASVLLSATLMVAQPRMLRGRDPVAVTAAQFLGAAAGVLPLAISSGGIAVPSAGELVPVLATLALAVAGTMAPFTLFAYGQKRVPAEVAGAFVNIEPVVGAVAGVVVFGDPAGPSQLVGGLAILAGIAMSSWRMTSKVRVRQAAETARPEPGRCWLLPGCGRLGHEGLQLLHVHREVEIAIAKDQLGDRHRAVPHDLTLVPDPGRNRPIALVRR